MQGRAMASPSRAQEKKIVKRKPPAELKQNHKALACMSLELDNPQITNLLMIRKETAPQAFVLSLPPREKIELGSSYFGNQNVQRGRPTTKPKRFQCGACGNRYVARRGLLDHKCKGGTLRDCDPAERRICGSTCAKDFTCILQHHVGHVSCAEATVAEPEHRGETLMVPMELTERNAPVVEISVDSDDQDAEFK